MYLPTSREPALLVIDAQKAHTAPRSPLYCKQAKATIDRINPLIAAFKKAHHPVVYIRHEHERDGHDVGRMWGNDGTDPKDFPFKKGTKSTEYADGLDRLRGAPEVIKTRHNAFENTDLKHILDEVDADHVVITGFMTHLCCEATARQAHDMDYEVTYIPEATGTPDLFDDWPQERVREAVAAVLASGVAKIMDVGAFLEAEATP